MVQHDDDDDKYEKIAVWKWLKQSFRNPLKQCDCIKNIFFVSSSWAKVNELLLLKLKVECKF